MSAQENVWSSRFFFLLNTFLREVVFFFFLLYPFFEFHVGLSLSTETREGSHRTCVTSTGLFGGLTWKSMVCLLISIWLLFFFEFLLLFFFFFPLSCFVFKVSKATESKCTPSVKQWQDKKKRRGLVVCVAQERSVPQCVASLSSEAEQMDGTWTVLAFFSLFFFPDELSFP